MPAEASEKEKFSFEILISKCREVRERGAHFCLARSVNLRTGGRAHHFVWEDCTRAAVRPRLGEAGARITHLARGGVDGCMVGSGTLGRLPAFLSGVPGSAD